MSNNTTGTKLLVVDDDNRLRDLLRKYLSDKGFDVTCAADAEHAQSCLDQSSFDMVILDVMMPGKTGLDFAKEVRDSSKTYKFIPILMLTALGDPENRISGLECGADDYLTKPFEPKELLLRIEKILARINPNQTLPKNLVRLGTLHFDPEKHSLFNKNERIHLTSAELNLLDVLTKNLRMTLSRDELAERCGVSLSPRTVDVQITRLRRKIEVDPKKPLYIRTVRHKGYVLWPDE